jgi:O-antigen/teichoic acid export membrane protein
MLIMATSRGIRPNIDWAITIQLLKFGLPFLPVILLKWVVDLSDRYLVGIYTTADEVGIYSLGYKFGQVMSFIITAFSFGWVPIRFKMLSLAEPQIAYGRVTTIYLAGAGMIWLSLSTRLRLTYHQSHSPTWFTACLFYRLPGLASPSGRRACH